MLAARLHEPACQSVCAYRGKKHCFAYIAEPVLEYALLRVALCWSRLRVLQSLHDNGMHRLSSASVVVAGQVPLGGELHRVGYDIFDVVVAPLSFFDLWVQPHVRCRVRCARQPHQPGVLSCTAPLFLIKSFC